MFEAPDRCLTILVRTSETATRGFAQSGNSPLGQCGIFALCARLHLEVIQPRHLIRGRPSRGAQKALPSTWRSSKKCACFLKCQPWRAWEEFRLIPITEVT